MAKYKIIPSSRTIVQSPISIGHKAEKGVEAIEFDLTAWVETYGSGTATIVMKRWGDSIPYPIALEIDENNKATWTLSDIDTAKAGMAYAQLSYVVGDEVVKKSDIYTFRVMDSLTGEGDPPEAYESWLEHLTHFAAEAMAEVLDIESIVTDKTLTVDGGIADAKATGEALAEKVDAADYSELSARVGANTIALAEKADRSTTYTKAEVDTLIESVDVETDTTLSVSGKPADAAETGRQIGLLKADLSEQFNQVVTPVSTTTKTNINAQGHLVEIQSADDYGTYYAPVVEGIEYKIYFNDVSLVCAFFTSVPVIDAVSYNNSRTVQAEHRIVAPITGYICFRSTFTNPDTNAVYYITAVDKKARADIEKLDSDITDLDAQIDDLEADAGDTRYNINIINNTRIDVDDVAVYDGYMDTAGATHANASYFYTGQIPVQAGDSVVPYTTTTRPIRFATAFVNGVADSSKGSSTQLNGGFTVPDGVTSVVLSCYASDKSSMKYYIQRPVVTEIKDLFRNKNRWIVRQEENTLNAGDEIVISGSDYLYNKKNCSYSFWGNFTAFDAVTIGHGKTTLGSSYIVIDTTNLTVWQSNGSSVVKIGEYAHGLTFNDFIAVNINVADSATPNAKITIRTNTGQFIQNDILFVGCRDAVYAKTDDPMSDVVLAYAMDDLRKDVFIFGDSYISLNDINRWPYYIDAAGYDNYMLCGFPGAGSISIREAFKSVITLARPKIVAWCVGMNNGDSETAYNADWKTALDYVMQICADAKIELVLATIPNTPTVTNYYKNQYVKDSGYRYIDFAKAVGAESVGSGWYTSMLSSDNVHPTQIGARTLATRVLTDLPEMC